MIFFFTFFKENKNYTENNDNVGGKLQQNFIEYKSRSNSFSYGNNYWLGQEEEDIEAIYCPGEP